MRAAIVGAGRMGRRHMQAVRDAGLALIGIADSNPAALEQAKSEGQLPDALLYQDSARMLAETHAECLIVATTAPSHHELVMRAVDAGVRHILCEKPMAVSLEQCDEMIALCHRH